MADLTDTFYAGDAFVGYGSQLLVGDGASPETFEAIADIIDITPGAMTTAVVDKTHLRSPNRHMEKIATIRDSGPFKVTGNWKPTAESQSNTGGGASVFANGGVLAMWRNVTEKNWIIRLSDGSPATDWPFRGVITNFTPGAISATAKVDFTMEITPLQDFSSSLP